MYETTDTENISFKRNLVIHNEVYIKIQKYLKCIIHAYIYIYMFHISNCKYYYFRNKSHQSHRPLPGIC